MWTEVAPIPPSADHARWGVRVAAPLAAAAFLWWAGAHGAAVVVVLVAGALLVAAAASPRVGVVEARVLAAVGHGVGRALTVVGLGLVALLVVLPVWALGRLLRTDPLDERGGAWRARPGRDHPRRAYADERRPVRPGSAPVRVLRGTALALGGILLFVALDVGLGYSWDHFIGSHDVPVALDLPGRDEVLGPNPSPSEHPMDQRYREPAMAAYPWAEAYFREFSQLDYDYVAYLYPRVRETHGRFINSAGGVRRSYEPVLPVGRDAPTIWFFGGSTTWGEGQRDRHTIASEVARIAEAEGLPVRVVNYGERGYVAWQETQVFERALAHAPAPDLAVFYDGINDLTVQREQPTDDPTHFDFARMRYALTGLGLEPGDTETQVVVRPPTLADDVDDLLDRYVEVSAVAKVARRVHSLFSVQPAMAEQDPDSDTIVNNAARVYRRSHSVAQLLAERDGATPLFFLQPIQGGRFDGSGYDRFHDRVADATIDLTTALDAHQYDEQVYLDGAHTNELGARLVAEAMWTHLRPQVEAWYTQHGG